MSDLATPDSILIGLGAGVMPRVERWVDLLGVQNPNIREEFFNLVEDLCPGCKVELFS